MTIDQLLSHLENNGVEVWVENDELRYRGSSDSLPQSILAEMAQHKAELLTRLRDKSLRPNGAAAGVAQGATAPLSLDQESLWFLETLHGGNPANHVFHASRLRGELDLTALEQALSRVVERHEALRTTFRIGDSGPEQTINEAQPVKIAIEDLRQMPEETREEECRHRCSVGFRRRFDLEAGPLLRVSAMRLDEYDWVLLIVVHHIVFDNASFTILFRELAELYRERVAGRPARLPPVPLQYREYAVRQRTQQEADPRVAKQVSFWEQQLRDTPVLEIPGDRTRPGLQSPDGAEAPLSIPAPLLAALKATGRSAQASPFMTLLAAWQALLHRYSGQGRIAVGSPVSVRTRPELDEVVGLFLNVLVLETEVESELSFRELLARTRSTALAAFANQDVPFERLVGLLKPDRDLSHNPLFQVMLQLSPKQHMGLEGLEASPFDFDRGTSQFDLSLHLFEVEDRLDGYIEYDSDLYEAGRIARMADHFLSLLQAVVDDPDIPVGDIGLLTGHERSQILDVWNETAVPLPADQTVHELFERQVRLGPHEPALIRPEALTYAELNEKANRLAHHLISLGVGPNTPVAIALERGTDMLVSVLATLKAGGAYVPMDPAFPDQRLSFMLQDSQAAIVITKDASRQPFLSDATSTLILDLGAAPPLQHPADDPRVVCSPADLAYIIYTSGSTGVPKGVMVPHGAVVNFIMSMARRPGMTSSDRIAAVTTLSFDIHVLELLLPLSVGARIALVSSDDAMDGAALSRVISETECTMMQATPATWRLLVDAGWHGPPDFKALCGGEALPGDLSGELIKRTAELWNLYGPTETTVWSTCARVTDPDRLSIGRPIDNTTLYVLDSRGQPTPVGVPGELYIGGAGVTAGYHNRPELTAERFVPNPFQSNPDVRLYRTGDLVTYRPDGSLDYLRRTDDQVKLRGFRIELGEIESVLAGHTAVDRAAVAIRQTEDGNKRLVAYVVPATDGEPNVGGMRAFLLERLPGYMVPALFVMLESLPLTPNGKIDRKALPEPEGLRPSLEADYVAPRSETEATLTKIWEGLLDLDRVGIHDNFFDVGGDSLLAMSSIVRASKQGVNLTLRHLFEYPTVAELADAAVSRDQLPTTTRELEVGPVVNTPGMSRFLIERQSPDLHHWNVSLLLSINQGLDSGLLAGAIECALGQHAALRLRIAGGDRYWRQWLVEEAEPRPVETHDLAALPESQQDNRIAAVARRLSETLDLEHGPVVGIAHFDLGARGERVFLVVHHLICDGMSLGILIEDIEMAYSQLASGEEVQLLPEEASVQVWAASLEAAAQSETLRDDFDYLQSLPWHRVCLTPGLMERRHENTNASARAVTVNLTEVATRELTVADTGGSLEETLIAALALAARRPESPIVHLERLGLGRTDSSLDLDLSRTVGFMLSYTPLVLDVGEPGRGQVERLISQIQAGLSRELAFDLLRWMSDEKDVRESLHRLPRAELSFNFLSNTDRFIDPESMFSVAPENRLAASNHSPAGLRYYPTSVVARIESDVLSTTFVYSSALHSEAAVARLAQDYLRELGRVLSFERQ